MKKYCFVVLVFCVCFVSVGFIGGYKAALNQFCADVKPNPGFEAAFDEWTANYGKSIDSIQFYKMAELATIINQHAAIINKKADVNDVVLRVKDINE